MLGAEGILADLQRAPVQRQGTLGVTQRLPGNGETAQSIGDHRVIWAERRLADGQRPLLKRQSVASPLQRDQRCSEVVQRAGDVRMAGTEHALEAVECALLPR